MSAPGTDLQSWRWLRGRARRREYWLWLAVIVAWMQVLGAAGDTLAMQVLSWALLFAFARRLHDVGLGADWIVVSAIIALTLALHATRTGQGWAAAGGGLAILVAVVGLGLVPGQSGANRFGPPPGSRPAMTAVA